MILSRYNILFEEGGSSYMYNTLSTALIQFDKTVASAIRKGDLSTLSDSLLSQMVELHFIVEDNANEIFEYMHFYNSVKYRLSACSLGIIFVPTYSCNLNCPYCLQGSLKNQGIINEESLEAVLKFVKKQIQKSSKDGHPIRVINASIFGGEPLVAKDITIKFCDTIYEIAQTNGCKTNFLLTTNATLIDREVIELIRKYNIGIQISIDGNKELHDKSRIRHNGSGTYDCIVGKLKELNDSGLKKNVIIRINTNKENINVVEDVIRDVKPYANEIYCGFLSEFKGYNDGYSSCLSFKQYSDVLTKDLYPLYQKYGIRIYRAFGKMSPCNICMENRFVIDNKLDVYKCETLINQQDAKVGTIDLDGNIHFNNNYYKQMAISPLRSKKCLDCRILPYCGGGCVGKAYVNKNKRDGNFDCYECTVTEKDLLTFIKDYIHRQQNVNQERSV